MGYQNSELFDYIKVTRHFLELKFKTSVRATSLVGAFDMGLDEESLIGSQAFQPIDTRNHYNSLARILQLHFGQNMFSPGGLLTGDATTFSLKVSGLRKPSGESMPEEVLTFRYDFENQPTVKPLPTAEIENFAIKDYSLLPSGPIGNGSQSAEELLVTSPEVNDSIFVVGQHLDGKIKLYFSKSVVRESVDSDTIFAQKKSLEKNFQKWTTIPLEFDFASDDRVVISQFPNNGGEEDPLYFESNSKYRIVVTNQVKVY